MVMNGSPGDILPIRAHYDPVGGDLGIGVNPYHLDRPVWYALPDVIAATILTGRHHASPKRCA